VNRRRKKKKRESASEQKGKRKSDWQRKVFSSRGVGNATLKFGRRLNPCPGGGDWGARPQGLWRGLRKHQHQAVNLLTEERKEDGKTRRGEKKLPRNSMTESPKSAFHAEKASEINREGMDVAESGHPKEFLRKYRRSGRRKGENQKRE